MIGKDLLLLLFLVATIEETNVLNLVISPTGESDQVHPYLWQFH